MELFLIIALMVFLIISLQMCHRKPTKIPGTIKVVTDTSDGQTYITVELNSYADLEQLKRSKTVILKVDSVNIK